MKITSAKFIKGIVGPDPIFLSDMPQIAFVGRSNAGKSSLINSLLGRRELVKTSSMPGKTRQINYFLINEGFYFADLPGYGFARISQADREKLKDLILWYLLQTKIQNRKTVLIIDAKVGMSATDMELLDAMRARRRGEVIIVANKIDRLNQKARAAVLRDISEFAEDLEIYPYSSKTGEGKEKLWQRIAS